MIWGSHVLSYLFFKEGSKQNENIKWQMKKKQKN